MTLSIKAFLLTTHRITTNHALNCNAHIKTLDRRTVNIMTCSKMTLYKTSLIIIMKLCQHGMTTPSILCLFTQCRLSWMSFKLC